MDSTKAVFFFRTPHKGSDFVNAVLRASLPLELLSSGTAEFITGQGKLFNRALLKELSTNSMQSKDLCSAFVERAHHIPCIASFCEVNKIQGHIVSAIPPSDRVLMYLKGTTDLDYPFPTHDLPPTSLVNSLMKLLLQTVSQESATIGVAHENVVPLDGKDHREICRIKDEKDEAYKEIIQECQKIGNNGHGAVRSKKIAAPCGNT